MSQSENIKRNPRRHITAEDRNQKRNQKKTTKLQSKRVEHLNENEKNKFAMTFLN